MRRLAALMVVLALLSGAFVARDASIQGAQERTPEVERVPATPVTTLPAWDPDFGFAIEELASGEPVAAVGSEVRLFRVTIAPDGAIPDQYHPGPAVLYVEAGTVAVTALEGNVSYLAQPIAVGEEVLLGPGDAVSISEGAGYFAQNGGDVPAVVLISGFFETDEPAFAFPIVAEACMGGC